MKKKLILFVLLIAMLVVSVGCNSSVVVVQTSTPDPDAPVVTPTPNGQINVPGFSLQVFAPGPNPLANTPDAQNHIASVLLGIWHGIISPITLTISFFNPNVQMYEVHNDGSPYNLGFLVGVAIVFLLLGVTAGRRRH
ncbi:MAG TPA: hypothetical protein VN376_04540 [Longilinea sp.]|nr:hypothetical protein [Longilinea sp.]